MTTSTAAHRPVPHPARTWDPTASTPRTAPAVTAPTWPGRKRPVPASMVRPRLTHRPTAT